MRRILLVLLLPVAASASFPEDLSWADHLYRRGEYGLAIIEYRRLLFLHPKDAAQASVPVRVAWAYFLHGDHADLRRFLSEPGLDDPKESRYLAGLSAFREGRFILAYERLSPLLEDSGLPTERAATVRIALAAMLAATGERQEALRILSPPPGVQGPALESFVRMQKEIRRIGRPKDPSVAALLGLMPGAGLLYAGDVPKSLTFFMAAVFTGVGGWLSLSDRDWSKPQTRDYLDLSLWSLGAAVLVGRSAAESWQAAETSNRRRLERLLRPFEELKPWGAPQPP